MERIVEKSLLFDFYGELLTGHQKDIYSLYVQEDVSVSEIAQLQGISRQGAHDMIRRCEKLLTGYESRLHLVDHYMKIKKMVRSIQECTEVIEHSSEMDEIHEKVRMIGEITKDILEQY